jgi:hypothetical protein
MKLYRLQWMPALAAILVLCPMHLRAQGAAEYGITTSVTGALGAKIGSALGGAIKQATPTLQQVLPQSPNPNANRKPAAGKAMAGKMVAKKEPAGKATQNGAGTASGVSMVQIDSTPAGAAILIDNVALGHTPASLTLSKGIHVIEISHDGLTTWQKTILLGDGEKLSLNAALKDPKISRPLFTVQR